MKLGIIVPYRNRPTHLQKFRDSIHKYFRNQDYALTAIISI